MNTPVQDPIRIGPHQLSGIALLAPMAGVSDAPFRRVCIDWGAALAATEMTLANHGIRAQAVADVEWVIFCFCLDFFFDF